MAMLLFLQIFSFSLLLSLPFHNAISTRNLDTLLQDYAFKALSNPNTRLPYDATLPNNLTGVKVSAMRLTSSSLRTRGVHNYKEFQIPIGVIEKPYILVYQNLGNFSEKFYPLPNGFSYLTPVLGLLSYSGVNLSTTELPELVDIRASDNNPILIKFSDVKPVPYGSVPKCVYFDLNGSVHYDIVYNGNMCKTVKLGHFAIVVESNKESSLIHGTMKKTKTKTKKKKNKKIKNSKKMKKSLNLKALTIALCLIVGFIILLILVLLLVCWLRKKKLQKKELESQKNNEALQIKHVAGTNS